MPEHVYWRRRAIVVAALLCAVGLIAWSCAAPGDSGRREVGTGQPAALPRSAPPSAHTTASPDQGATVTVTAAPEPPSSRSPSLSSRSPSASLASAPGGPAKDARKRRACRRGDLRVALWADSEAYRTGERPSFTLRVTAGRRCKADLGPKNLRIVITSGSDRIWSSADCEQRRSTKREVSPHRPYRTVVTWRRLRSAPGDCGEARERTRARPGWYVAVAELGSRNGQLRSKKAAFQLN